MSSSQTWAAVVDLYGHADHLAALLAHLDETLGAVILPERRWLSVGPDLRVHG